MTKTHLKSLCLSGAALAVAALMPWQSASADVPGTDKRCYDPANAGTVGQADWAGCAGMYIVKKRWELNDAKSRARRTGIYGINYDGTDYTFGDSDHNIFTGQVTDFSLLFTELYSPDNDFNEDIGYWDTSNVESMHAMFAKATAFNQNIGSWDTSNVKSMERMFSGASSFNQDLSGWNVFNVTAHNNHSFDEKTSETWTDDEKPVWGTKGRDAGPAPSGYARPGAIDIMAMGGVRHEGAERAAPLKTVEVSAFIASAMTFKRGNAYVAAQSGRIEFEDSGDFVVKDMTGDTVTWRLSDVTDRWRDVARVSFQEDGNLAAYDANDGYIWSALHTQPPAGTTLVIDPSGILILASPAGEFLWTNLG